MLITKITKKILFLIIMIAAIAGVAAMTVNIHMQKVSKGDIIASADSGTVLSSREICKIMEFKPQCVMVLGAGIEDRQTPSKILKDRLDLGIYLYKKGAADKLLLTGDNGRVEHNEIHVMLNYAKKRGVPGKDIFCDHAGFSTYDSVRRAEDIFRVKKMVIVTQTYHMYRALYIADKLDIDAVGVSSDQREYRGQPEREVREVLARNKDFIKCIYKPDAVGGDQYSITGDGRPTHGE